MGRHSNSNFLFWKYSGDVNSYEKTKQALKFVASEQKDITTIRGIENDDVPPLSSPFPEVMFSSSNLHTPSLIRDDEKEQIFCSSPSLRKNAPSSSSICSKPLPSPFLKEEKTIIFPKLKKVENSIIIINSKTEGIDIDKLCRVRTTTPMQMSTEEENIISRKLCDDLNPSTANFNEKENYSVSSPIFKEEKEAQSNPEHADDEQSNPIPEDTNTSPDTKSRKFIVPKTTSVTINKDTWKELYSRRIKNTNGEDILPPGWGDSIVMCG